MKISRSTLLATALLAAVAIWMLTGLAGDPAPPGSAPPPLQPERDPVPVTVSESTATVVIREIRVSARTEPNRVVELAAETAGRVVAVGAERGAPVLEGEAIVTLDLRERALRVAEAEALVRQRELEHQAAERLRGREFLSESEIAAAASQLESARVALAAARQDLARTSIVAPFDGVLEERGVELGRFLNVGDPVAVLVDADPLIVTGDVSERQIHALRAGTRGSAGLLSGGTVQGNIRYVSPVANEATRTFRVELAIPNPGNALRAGMSAELVLPAGEVEAHLLSPALLTLDDAGKVGVKAVDDYDRVQFHPVEIVMSEQRGIWVTGLPPRARVITVGQGFVMPGETVAPVTATDVLPLTESGGRNARAD